MTSVPFSHPECGVQRASGVCISLSIGLDLALCVCPPCACVLRVLRVRVQSILIFVVTTISVILGSLKLDLYIVRDHSPY